MGIMGDWECLTYRWDDQGKQINASADGGGWECCASNINRVIGTADFFGHASEKTSLWTNDNNNNKNSLALLVSHFSNHVLKVHFYLVFTP